jgi:tRNA(Arg) A34 adenosine deaminase TadA
VTPWFDQLVEPWQLALENAWTSFRDGNSPIGAVIVDVTGTVVASGRSRRLSAHDGPGRLAGTNIAHAELNALTALPRADYSDHVLYTTLRPCFLCTAAVVHSRVGHVSFAGDDPVVRGVERLPELGQQIARRWPTWEGPANGALRVFAELVAIVFEYQHDVDGDTSAYEANSPRSAELARQVLKDGRAERFATLDLAKGLRLLPELDNGGHS